VSLGLRRGKETASERQRDVIETERVADKERKYGVRFGRSGIS
jgi:hypothetical protein